MNILKGTALYSDKSVFLRELIQNAYDAIECKISNNPKVKGKIEIEYNSKTKELLFKDNGVGIDKEIFENYVVNIGQSYYRSKDFKNKYSSFKPIGKFGIGIISNFMVSDSIIIKSIKEDKYGYLSKPINYEIFVDKEIIISFPLTVEEFKNKYDGFNTVIQLSLKENLNTSIDELLKTIVSYNKYEITIIIDGKKEILGNDLFVNKLKKFKTIVNHLEYNEISLQNKEFEGSLFLRKLDDSFPFLLSQSGIIIKEEQYNDYYAKRLLRLSWIENFSFCLNLLDTQIDLKASRDSIIENNTFLGFRKKIIKLLIENNLQELSLCQSYNWHMDILDTEEFNYVSNNFKFRGKKEYVLKDLFENDTVFVNKNVKLNKKVTKNKNIIYDTSDIYELRSILYFFEINDVPYELYYVITKSCIYLELINHNKNLEIMYNNNKKNIDYYLINDFRSKGNINKDIFLIVSPASEYRPEIIYNQMHKLDILFMENSENSNIKIFLRLMTDVFSRLLNNEINLDFKVKESNKKEERIHLFITDEMLLKFENKITQKLINKINKFIKKKILKELNINKEDYNQYTLTKDSFPKWYTK